MTGHFQIIGQQNKIKQGTYLETFGLVGKEAPIVAVVGAGGKTTLIELLSEEYAKAGSRVIVTTTTHMLCPMQYSVLFTDRPGVADQISPIDMTDFMKEKISELPSGILYIAEHAADYSRSRKLAPISEAFQKALFQCGYPVLIEADGSKGLPCKMPEAHEPVIPKEVTTVIGVLSAKAIGQPIKKCCHRAELAADFLHKSAEHVIEMQDLEKIAASERGLRKSVQDTMEFYAVLNRY